MGLSSSPGLSYSTFVLSWTYFSKILKPLLGCAPGNQEQQNLKIAVQGVGGGGEDGGGGYILKKMLFSKTRLALKLITTETILYFSF